MILEKHVSTVVILFFCVVSRSRFKFRCSHRYAFESHIFLPEKSIAIDQNIPGLPCAALALQTAAPQFEKGRCYFLFLPHQTHPRSNVKLFKQGVTCSCPVGFDVRRCNNTKDVLKLRLPATSSYFLQYLLANQMETDSVHRPVLSFHSWFIICVPSPSRRIHYYLPAP